MIGQIYGKTALLQGHAAFNQKWLDLRLLLRLQNCNFLEGLGRTVE